jgi:archaellin
MENLVLPVQYVSIFIQCYTGGSGVALTKRGIVINWHHQHRALFRRYNCSDEVIYRSQTKEYRDSSTGSVQVLYKMCYYEFSCVLQMCTPVRFSCSEKYYYST